MRSIPKVLWVLLALCGCQDRATAPDVQGPPPTPAAAAVVNGEVILRTEIDDQVAIRAGGRTLTSEERRRLLRAALDAQIEATLVAAAVREAGIQPPV